MMLQTEWHLSFTKHVFISIGYKFTYAHQERDSDIAFVEM